MVSELARLHREEARGALTEAQVCARDGRGGAGDEVPPDNHVPTCHYPGGIFEELPALAPELLRPSEISGQSWKKASEGTSRSRVNFLIPLESQRPWSPPVGFQCVYESYFQDETKLWFPIPRLVTTYVRRRGAAISLCLNASWRIAVALMVMAAEIDITRSVLSFEELTSLNPLDEGLLSIKLRPNYNVVGGHPSKTLDWQRSYFYVKSDDSTF